MTEDEPNPWAEVVRPCFTVTSMARTLGWTEAEVGDAAASLTVLEVTTSDGVVLHPSFQVRDGQLVEGLDAVLQVLNTGTKSPWMWALSLNTRIDDESAEEAPSALEQLRAGKLEDVLRDASHTAWAWRN